MDKILLNSVKKIGGTNDECIVKTELSSSVRLFPGNDIKGKIDMMEEYNLERDNCSRIRILAGIHPYCTNVLYNRKTEIIKDEGSDSCVCLNFKNLKIDADDLAKHFSKRQIVTFENAMENTEYSSPEFENLRYHCGIDMFNNVRFREKDFNVLIGHSDEKSNIDDFNTIRDKIRNDDGECITDIVTTIKSSGRSKYLKDTEINPHQYTIDNLNDFRTSYNNNVYHKDGWFGFENVTRLNKPTVNFRENNYSVSLNRVLNNNKPGEFIDFYPDRSLFSFIPKYNKFRKREEENWKYCLTYPSRSDYDLFSKINGGNKKNLIEIVKYSIFTLNPGNEQIIFQTRIRHNLKKGSLILLRNLLGKDDKKFRAIKVTYVGNPINKEYKDDEHYFCIRKKDADYLFNEDEETGKKLGFKKIIDNAVSSYYVRWFSKIDGIKSNIGKTGYSETLFGDRNAEIVFTDAVDVYSLKDNRNRPLTELFLTIIKNNKGNNLWYNNHITTSENIEFSHCFGKVSAGIDMPSNCINKDYNVHIINELDFTSDTNTNDKDLFSDILNVKKLNEKEILITDDEFLGDIVEYDPVNDKEVVIEKIYYRFNTAQREDAKTESFKGFPVDVIESDDYDILGSSTTFDKFKVKRVNLSKWNKGEGNVVEVSANLAPEGYYYNPHYSIKIRKFSEILSESEGTPINVDTHSGYNKIGKFHLDINTGKYVEGEGEIKEFNIFGVRIRSLKKYDLMVGNKIYFYNDKNKQYYWGTVVEVNKDNKVLIKVFGENPNITFNLLHIIKSEKVIPNYATFLKDTTEKFVWREILPYSKMSNNEELYNIPYSNGCLYFEKNFNFFLRRQDPFGKYGLRTPLGRNIEMSYYTIPGEEYDTGRQIYISGINQLSC